MNASDFDDIISAFVTKPSPRRVLGKLLSGAIALLADASSRDAEAKCVKLGKKCKKKGRKRKCCGGAKCKKKCACRSTDKACNGACIPGTSCCGDAECNGGICQDGACRRAPFQGTCTAAQDSCVSGAGLLRCGSTPDQCICTITTAGRSFCALDTGLYILEGGCTTDEQCKTNPVIPAADRPNAVCLRQGGFFICEAFPCAIPCTT